MAQFTNQAQLSYGGTVLNSNVAVGEIREVLSAAKATTSSGYTVGEDVTYIVSIVNSGTSPYTGVTVTDSMGEYALRDGYERLSADLCRRLCAAVCRRRSADCADRSCG